MEISLLWQKQDRCIISYISHVIIFRFYLKTFKLHRVTEKNMSTNEIERVGRRGANQTGPQLDPGATHLKIHIQCQYSPKFCRN